MRVGPLEPVCRNGLTHLKLRWLRARVISVMEACHDRGVEDADYLILPNALRTLSGVNG